MNFLFYKILCIVFVFARTQGMYLYYVLLPLMYFLSIMMGTERRNTQTDHAIYLITNSFYALPYLLKIY